MPVIFDNIQNDLLPTLRKAMEASQRADFCVGYFNLRGWRFLDEYVEKWAGGEGHCCRLLVGMQRLPEEELRIALRMHENADPLAQLDTGESKKLLRKLAENFRQQLQMGAPTEADERGLRRLAGQIRTGKVVVKLFLRYPLHAKLYLLQRPDALSPKLGFLGSSNLTMAGLRAQGELNVDITDTDAWDKLSRWFSDRWLDRWCLDISTQLADIIESSWARPVQPPPYHIYLKMAYHLAEDARLGEDEFDLPDDMGNKLLEFQRKAVKLALRKIRTQRGVMIGDVVGLGKTLVGSAIAKAIQEEKNHETLVICPRNLVEMWKDYLHSYEIRGDVMPLSLVDRKLKDEKRFRTVLIDESHNLRNRETAKYKAVRDYIERNESDVILLTATPYNKELIDLSSQLRLFLAAEAQLGVRPENFIRQHGMDMLSARTQADPHTIAAFEKTDLPEDWRLLMDQFLVRRTRGFIKKNYAKLDPANGRQYLQFHDGRKSYFPKRVLRSVTFAVDENNAADQYAKMHADETVQAINGLRLPRYGLGNYVKAPLHWPDSSEAHRKLVDDLSRAGKHLIGFCRTSFFKRLESSGAAFELTIERHIQRDKAALFAFQNNLDVAIGSSDATIFETTVVDNDSLVDAVDDSQENDIAGGYTPDETQAIYTRMQDNKAFRWLPAKFFDAALAAHLQEDIAALELIRKRVGDWDPANDAKLMELTKLLKQTYAREKVLIFTQFADTANYLERQLNRAGVTALAVVTGQSENPTKLVQQFSPVSNEARSRIGTDNELRVLVSTDVLSEGQNLQDCAVVVNFDLPWALIRLIQRVGRVDRIGQQSPEILVHSFLPADGVERIIRLHQRIRQRQRQEGEIIGSDEMFIEGDPVENTEMFHNLFNENSAMLEREDESDVDISSYASEIWRKATENDPKLAAAIEALPNVVYSTREHKPTNGQPEGVITFTRNATGNNSLIWLDKQGEIVTEAAKEILRAAECNPQAPAVERFPDHHEWVGNALAIAVKDQRAVGGQLGGSRSVRRKVYDLLTAYDASLGNSLFKPPELDRTIDELYRYPLKDSARERLGKRLREKVDSDALARLVIELRAENELCNVAEEPEQADPHIICSLGLRRADGNGDR